MVGNCKPTGNQPPPDFLRSGEILARRIGFLRYRPLMISAAKRARAMDMIQAAHDASDIIIANQLHDRRCSGANQRSQGKVILLLPFEEL